MESKIKNAISQADAIKRSRVRFTIIITLIAWVFFALIFGSVIGAQAIIMDNDNDTILKNALTVNSFFSDENFPGNNPPMLGNPEAERCIMVYYTNDIAYVKNEQLNIYSTDIQEQIVREGVIIGNGNYKVGSYYFKVASQDTKDNNTYYAIKDVTADHLRIQTMGIICLCGHFITVLIIGILAFFLTKNALKPVADAFEKQKELTANASHELKTPLTVISTNISVLKSEPDSTIKDNEKWIESIDNQVGKMQELIHGMLELSKLDSTKLLHVPLDLSNIVEGQCLDYEVVCFEKGIAFDTTIQPNITILGDKQTLSRVILILLDNAVKYSGKDGGKIELKLNADKKVAKLTVMNTGESISDEDAKRVFDRFYRVDGSRSKDVEDTSFGLGLAIAKTTVVDHGGEISCHGVENGTQFEVILPIPNKKDLHLAQEKLDDINAIKEDRAKKRDEYIDEKE